jgi:hypothetical protein
MGGVDLFHQKYASYNYKHICRKWYHAIYHFIKEAALVNSYILYQAENPESKMDAPAFRRQVADKLCASIPNNVMANRGRRSIDNFEDIEERLKGRHFAMMYEDPKYKPNCLVCSESTAHPKRKQTRYGCGECIDGRGRPIPLCMPACFKRYHTVKHYRV